MKIIYSMVLILLVLHRTWGDEPSSLEDFEKTTDPVVRARLIDQAPPDQKAKLRELDFLHRSLVEKWGSEQVLEEAKETAVLGDRGLWCLELVFRTYEDMRAAYVDGILSARLKAGASNEQQLQTKKELQQQEDIIIKRDSNVHLLVFNMAPSPAALELAKRASPLIDKLAKMATLDPSNPNRHITIEERRKLTIR